MKFVENVSEHFLQEAMYLKTLISSKSLLNTFYIIFYVCKVIDILKYS